MEVYKVKGGTGRVNGTLFSGWKCQKQEGIIFRCEGLCLRTCAGAWCLLPRMVVVAQVQQWHSERLLDRRVVAEG